MTLRRGRVRLTAVALATEPIGSIPRPRELLEGIEARAQGRILQSELDTLYEERRPFAIVPSSSTEEA